MKRSSPKFHAPCATDLMPLKKPGDDSALFMEQSLFAVVRAFLAEMEPKKILNQEQMAALLGCTTSNTYSKWERGDQVPPLTVCRNMELLLYHVLHERGEFVSREATAQRIYEFQKQFLGNTPNTALLNRAADVPRRLVVEHLAAYDCFCMMSGAATGNTITVDGYLPRLNAKTITITTGFNPNGKFNGNTFENICAAVSLISQPWYKDYADCILSDGSAAELDAILPSGYTNEDALGIPNFVLQEYKTHGIHYKGYINTPLLFVNRVNDSMLVHLNEVQIPLFNLFLKVAAKLAMDQDKEALTVEDLRRGLVPIVKKMLEAKDDNGSTYLPTGTFTIKHYISSNLRPKSRDINLIEKVLCHIAHIDPVSITQSAAMLVRNNYSRPLALAEDVLSHSGWSQYDEWFAQVTSRPRSDGKAYVRPAVNTHFFTAYPVERMLVIQLHKKPGMPTLEQLNAFLAESEGIANPKPTKDPTDVSSEVTLILGRTSKVQHGLQATPSGAYRIVGLGNSFRNTDPELIACVEARIAAKPNSLAERDLWDDTSIQSKTLVINDILSKRNMIRVHIFNAFERMLLRLENTGVDIDHLTHGNASGPLIKRESSELMFTHDERLAHFQDRSQALMARGIARKWDNPTIAKLLNILRIRLRLDTELNTAMTIVCKFFVFRIVGTSAVLTFKRASFVNAINEALASHVNQVEQLVDDDDDDGQETDQRTRK